jgi:hypothetical protein
MKTPSIIYSHISKTKISLHTKGRFHTVDVNLGPKLFKLEKKWVPTETHIYKYITIQNQSWKDRKHGE